LPGHAVQVDLQASTVKNHTTGRTYTATKMPTVMLKILQAGGLVAYLREHGQYPTE